MATVSVLPGGGASFLRRMAPLGLLCASLAHGQIAPNPGGPVVLTNSTSATITYVDTPVTQRVDNYSTTLVAVLNGTQVFSRTFPAAFTDPSVQAAIVQADAILSNAHATFGAPALTSSSSALQSSVTPPPSTVTCLQANSGHVGATGATTVTTVDTFGPATVPVGTCQSEIFNILSGQLDINVNTDFVFAFPRTIVTTNTFLTTSSYLISATGPATVPALSPLSFAALGLMLTALAAFLLGNSQHRVRS